MTGAAWATLVAGALAAGAITLWLTRRTRRMLEERLRRAARRALHAFRARLNRYKLVERDLIRSRLLQDPLIVEAMAQHRRDRPMAESEVRRRVNEYVDEIVPYFNVLSYYHLGYNVSRLLISLLYKVSVEYQDEDALRRIPHRDVVVYLMNHRSNADYVLVAFVLARVVSISYAVGEWARTWPLEYVFKSFGSYFIRRRYREPLYHAVLERYVQLITANGVTQGIFPEGGLTQDGALRQPKIGLLDYITGTLRDPAFDRDIWLVPVGINYDRVLEDRSLIRERIVGVARPGRLAQAATVVRYLALNTLRLFTGRLRRYGRAAVNFGTPVSVRAWLQAQPDPVLDLSREERLPRIQVLAELGMERVGAVIPVTPVALVAAALLSFGASVVPRPAVLERLDELRDSLGEVNVKLVRRELPVTEIWDRAWRMLRMRRLAVAEGEVIIILPGQRPLLEYYANSIRHLLPTRHEVTLSPAREGDSTLPRLAGREEDLGLRTEKPGLRT